MLQKLGIEVLTSLAMAMDEAATEKNLYYRARDWTDSGEKAFTVALENEKRKDFKEITSFAGAADSFTYRSWGKNQYFHDFENFVSLLQDISLLKL